MDAPALKLLVVIAPFFGALGAMSAFAITYEEYRKHLSARGALRNALRAAAFAFVVLVLLGAGAGYVVILLVAR